jgi:hypothetical protein
VTLRPVGAGAVWQIWEHQSFHFPLSEPAMNASVGDTFDPERTVPNADREPSPLRGTASRPWPVIPPCLRSAPQSPLPSDFERAVMDTAAHARYTGHCAAALRSRCRWVAAAAAGLLLLVLVTVLYLPSPWLALIPGVLAVAAAWRWAVFSAAADELHAESPR